jgi:TonB family protein
MIDAFAASPLVRAIGFALLQFLWQGAAIWAVTALVLTTLRRQTAQARYAAACLGLAAMVAAPAISAVGYWRQDHPVSPATAMSTSTLEAASAAAAGSRRDASASPAPAPRAFSREWLEPWLPFVMIGWSAGALLLALHLLYGWARVRQIQRTATSVTSHYAQDMMRRMAARIGVTQRLRLVESALVEVPSVIGFVRPAIIVPVSVLANLPPAQLEAILAHELAHIRRGDYLMNLLQCVVEVLLFYHPAVWWVSKQIRVEREHCCDDVAAALSDRVEYAHALVSLETLRAEIPALAMGATGGDLLGRIRRLVDPAPMPPRSSGWVAMTAVLTVLAVAAFGQIHGMAAGSQGPARLAATVVDPQGGVVPGVRVTIQRSDVTGSVETPVEIRTTLTDASGQFQFADLAPGEYALTASIPGFKSAKLRVALAANESVNGTLRLELGTLSEMITVRGEFVAAAAPVEPTATQATAADLEAARVLSAALSPPIERTGAIRVGGSIKEPKKIRDVKPAYPEMAMAAGVQGIVILEALIEQDGSVGDVRVLRSIALLDQAAVEAVRQWRFTPTLLNGQPVEVLMTVTVNFSGR